MMKPILFLSVLIASTVHAQDQLVNCSIKRGKTLGLPSLGTPFSHYYKLNATVDHQTLRLSQIALCQGTVAKSLGGMVATVA